MPTNQSRMIDFPSNGDQTPGYLALPENTPAPGVVVIQEFWGLVPHIKEVADRIAGAGYVALAPDLYHGKEAVEPDEARKLAMELDRARAVKEIQAAISYLRSLPEVAPKRIGVIGFCMGGSLAFATAIATPSLDAAVVFYGAPRELAGVQDIRTPLLAFYGGQDQGIPPERVQALEAAVDWSPAPHEFHIYPEAGHAFFNDTRPDHYHAAASEDAWQRSLAWLEKYLV